jgi:hypothetical protein
MIGESNIAALDDPTAKAVTCARLLNKDLRAMETQFKWSFSYKRQSFAAMTTPPVSGFTYQYQLPTDYLSVWGIGDDPLANGQPDYSLVYQIEMNSRLLTNEGPPLIIHLGVLVNDANMWAGAFEQALTDLVAADYAMAFPHDESLNKLYLQRYQQDLYDALAADGQKGSIQVYTSPDLIECRDG